MNSMLHRLPACLFLLAALLAAAPARITSVPLEPRRRQFPKTLVFPRAHLKYNLATNCFRQRQPADWVDRPLFGDHYDIPEGDLGYGGQQAYLDGVKICRDYGADGYAALVITVSESYISRMEKMFQWLPADSDFKILPELTIFKNIFGDPALAQAVSGPKPAQEAIFDRIFQTALASPHAVRHHGKIVISSYMGDSLAPAEWKQILAFWRQRYGDTFLFVPEVRMPLYAKRVPFTTKGGLTAQEIDEMKAVLRSYLDVCDGIHFAACNHLAALPENRYYSLEFFRDILVPVMVSVLNEPPYRGKLFGLGVAKGYINHRSHSNILEEGTKYLRGTLEAALSANPDYLILVEWNEMNENTNLEPTVCEGLTNQFIFRNYAGLPNPGRAGQAQPNLIVSIPWTRSYGEKLHLELLNLPEQDFVEDYTATIALHDEAGQAAWSSPAVRFPAGKRKAVQFTIPSESLAPAAFLHPVLTIQRPNAPPQVIADGLGAVYLHNGPNIICKDIKTPIRTLPILDKHEVRLSTQGGLTRATVEVRSREPLRFVELVRNHYTVWSASADIPEDTVKIRLSYNGWSALRKEVTFIRLKVENGDIRNVDDYLRHWSHLRWRREGRDAVVFAPDLTYGTMRGLAIEVQPHGRPEDCAIRMDLGKGHSYRFPLPALEGAGQNITSLKCASEFRLARAREVMDEPPALRTGTVQRTAVLGPSAPGDLWELRVVTMDGGVFHSRAIIPPDFAASPVITAPVRSETTGKSVAISMREAVWPKLEYIFQEDTNGWLKVIAPGHEDQFATLGGGCSVAYPFQNPARHPLPNAGGCPQWRSEAGHAHLHFDGRGDYLIFPAAAVPYRSLRLACRIRPDRDTRQFLMAQQGKSGGALAQVLLQKGALHILLRNRASQAFRFTTKPLVKTGVWNDLELATCGDRIRVTINGQVALDAPLADFEGLRANPLVFGGWDKAIPYFQGDLAAFRIQ